MTTHDYIVVGGGSAGCVLVNRLVKAGRSVLLLEAGPPDNTPFIHVPATFVKVIGSRRSFMYTTEPQPGANGRTMVVPQGRTLGGGSSLNAMIYIRGQREDYDEWESLGCTGWSYDEVLPVFRRSEGNERLAGPFHGTDGALKVSDPRFRHPISSAFVRAAQQAGYAYSDDFNGARQDGVGFYQTTTFNGRRGSTATMFLKSVKTSPLLTLRTECQVTELVLENGAATGLAFRGKDGTVARAQAREEIVLTAGAIGTPKILMLAGIGPSEELARHGIATRRHLPGVGENFQDHIAASVYGVTDRPISLLGQDRGLKAVANGLRYLMTRSGLLSSNVIESGGFLDTAGIGRPDIQIHVTPALVGNETRASLGRHGVSVTPCILRPTSRGRIGLRSADPEAPVVFDAGALATQDDCDTLVRGIKVSRAILRQAAFREHGFTEWLPGPAEDMDAAALDTYARDAAKTVYHPSGTCRMGRDPMAVVDPRLQVIGVPRLRVADASVMPTLVSGNTNAPCVMIAERCADFMLGGTA